VAYGILYHLVVNGIKGVDPCDQILSDSPRSLRNLVGALSTLLSGGLSEEQIWFPGNPLKYSRFSGL
jgi:hypothetical protein